MYSFVGAGLLLFVLVGAYIHTITVIAAPNLEINYQGKLTDSTNVAVPDGTYNMRFWLTTTPSIATTSALWTESLTTTNRVQVTNGLFSVMLGSTSPLTGVDFNQELYLGVEIGSTTTTPVWDGEMSPRKVLGAVPAAFESDRLDGLNSTQFARTDATSSVATSSTDTLFTVTQNGTGDIFNLFDGVTEVFSVLDGGNIGIGTTTPSRLLTVQGGDAWFGGNVTATGTLTISGATTLSSTLGVTGLATFNYASTTGLSGTNLNFTNGLFTGATSTAFQATTLGVGSDYITDITGTGLTLSAAGVLSATGDGVSNWLYNGSRLSPSTTVGIGIFASSTIGNGTGVGGLTVNGNSTTTLAAYVGTTLGIGTTSPSATFALRGSGTTNPLMIASSSGYALLTVQANGNIGIGTSTPTALLALAGSATQSDSLFRISNSNQSVLMEMLADGSLDIGGGGIYYNAGTNQTSIANLSLGTTNFDTDGGVLSWVDLAIESAATSTAESYTATIDSNPVLTVYGESNGQGGAMNLRVGIASSTPSRTLTVEGEGFFTNNVTFSSTTIANALITNATTTNATSTYFYASNLTATSAILTAFLGTNATVTNATSTNFFATNLRTINLFSTLASTTYASSTSLSLYGSLFDRTGSGGTNGMVLQTTGSGVTWVATSSLGFSAGAGDGVSNWLYNGSRLSPSTTVGVGIFASSTIGGGTGITGLTINGSATTTGRLTIGTNANTDIFINSGSTTLTTSRNVAIGNQAFSFFTSSATDNTALGYQALRGSSTVPMTGGFNFAAGYQALYFNTTGASNNAIGPQALRANTTGANNNALGEWSLYSNTSGIENNAFGAWALRSNTTGSYNDAFGSGAFLNSVTGSGNVALGYLVGDTITTGSANTFLGFDADATGDFSTSTAIGAKAIVGCSNCMVLGGTGVDYANVGIGTTTPSRLLTVIGDLYAANNITAASGTITYASTTGFTATNITTTNLFSTLASTTYASSTSLSLYGSLFDRTGSGGTNGMVLQTTGSGVTWVATSSLGFSAGAGDGVSNWLYNGSRLSPSTTVGVGIFASSTIGGGTGITGLTINGSATTTGRLTIGTNANTDIFINSGSTTLTAGNNVAMGNQALTYFTAGATYNTAIGYQALLGSSTVPMTGDYNIAFGYQSGFANTTGQNNIFFGQNAGFRNTTGSGNIFSGQNAGYSNTTGIDNIFSGFFAGYSNTTGSHNVISGNQASYSNSTGSNNVALGHFAGDTITTGSANTFLGFDADATGDYATSTAIGAKAIVGCSNCMVLGGTGVDYANVGIGTTTPSRLLTVQGGDAWFGGNVTATGTLTISGATTLSSTLGVTGLATFNYASTTGLSGTNLNFTNGLFTGATSTAFQATTLGVGSDYITDITGTGLTLSAAGVLSATGDGVSNWLYNGSRLSPSTTVGIGIFASSTIGGGTGATGLTIYGNSTTTLNAYVAGSVGIGTSSPSAKFSIEQRLTGTGSLFQIASSSNGTATTTNFIVDAFGRVGIGSTTPSAQLSIQGGSPANASGVVGLSVYGGNGGSGTAGQAGGGIMLVGGNASNGTAGRAGGSILLTAGNGGIATGFTTSGQGGSVTITAGNGGAGDEVNSIPSVGGSIFMSPGAGGDSTVAYGNILLASSGGSVVIGTSTPSAKLSIQNSYGSTAALFDIATTTSGAYATSSLFRVAHDGRVALGSTTPESLGLTISKTGLSGSLVAGVKEYLGFTNTVQSAIYYGDNVTITNAPTATSTLVGKVLRITDDTTLGNTVRGMEIQAHRGGNTKGENTGISAFGRTFGLRGTTEADAGDTYVPAGVYAETRGTTQGNALRAYSGSITSSSLAQLFHDTSHFTGTGLLMNFGNTGGSFAATTSAKFFDLQVGGTSKFMVAANGSTTIGDGIVSASLRVPFGGICVDNDGSCISTTTGQIRSVTSVLGNSDLAEIYFSSQALETGEIVALDGGLSVVRGDATNRDQVIGVVSTKPGSTLGYDDTSLRGGETGFPIGLKGRVPVKLSTENGPIVKGDRITLSSIAGIGMKATESDVVVGIALEDYDGTTAYSAGYLNQFGDDLVKAKLKPENQNTDARTQDGCSYGAGNEEGEIPCEKDVVTTLKTKTYSVDNKTEVLQDLRTKEAEVAITPHGEEVTIGQVIMFIEYSQYIIAAESDILKALNSTSSLTTGNGTETLFDRIKNLANAFVDGVLTLTGIKTNEVQTEELCVGAVCVDEATFLRMVETAGEMGTAGAGSGADVTPNANLGPSDTDTNTNPVSETVVTQESEIVPEPTLVSEIAVQETVPELPLESLDTEVTDTNKTSTESETTPEPAPEPEVVSELVIEPAT